MEFPRFGDNDISLRGIAVRGDDLVDLPAGLLEQGLELFRVEEVERPGLLEVDKLLGVIKEGAQGLDEEGFRTLRRQGLRGGRSSTAA
jgi:hypothetical protein